MKDSLDSISTEKALEMTLAVLESGNENVGWFLKSDLVIYKNRLSKVDAELIDANARRWRITGFLFDREGIGGLLCPKIKKYKFTARLAKNCFWGIIPKPFGAAPSRFN